MPEFLTRELAVKLDRENAMNDESNALMLRVMCSKDPTVRCAGQCDDPQCVTNANGKISVNFSCPNCPTHLAQIESLTREKERLMRTIDEYSYEDDCIVGLERELAANLNSWGKERYELMEERDTLRAELDAAKQLICDLAASDQITNPGLHLRKRARAMIARSRGETGEKIG